MKYLILIGTLLLINKVMNAQVKFRLYRENPCTHAIALDSTNYSVMSMTGKTYKPTGKEDGGVVLPGKGEYILYINETVGWTSFSTPKSKRIEVNSVDSFSFNYFEERLKKWIMGTDGYALYHICNDLAEGYQEDFYSNNNVRVRGNFKQGRPKDSLVFFYENGNTQKRIHYLKHWIIIHEYDTSSNLISTSRNSNKYFYLKDYKRIEYFPNGSIKLREKNIDGIKSIAQYFPSGNLKIKQDKWSRVEYFENGTKRLVYTWTRKKAEFSTRKEHQYDFVVQMVEFNANSEIVKIASYEKWGLFGYQPILSINRSDWIIKMVTFANGKETSRKEDIDTKEYLAGK